MDKLYYILDSMRDLDDDTLSAVNVFETFENHLENEDRQDAKRFVKLFRIITENFNNRVKKIAHELDEYLLENKIE